jgi:hypothetical protein
VSAWDRIIVERAHSLPLPIIGTFEAVMDLLPNKVILMEAVEMLMG